MGSVKSPAPIWGEFMHPLINENTPKSDPWQRNYYAPPPLKPLIPRRHPLVDIRPKIDAPGYSPIDHLKDQGFAIVKQQSDFLRQLDDGPLSERAIVETYHQEIKDLVKNTTGCKHVFITNSVFRQGKRAPAAYALPEGANEASKALQNKAIEHKLAGQQNVHMSAPVRVLHMDATPLGARQVIRLENKEINDVAKQTGIIHTEDQICPNPITKDSDSAIAEQYNARSPGPRYAAYSIWRPLRKVGRDPLAVSPRKKGSPTAVEAGMVHHFYENRIPGSAGMGGDFLKEYAMLGVDQEEAPAEAEATQWFYVSEQQADEVLFIKLFDSAALDSLSDHAPAPWHASPEIGGAATSDEPRESIDIRIMAFW